MEKRIAIVGYGNVGEPWALNLRDSGWKIDVLLRSNSKLEERARKNNFSPKSLDHVSDSPHLALLLPDDAMPLFWNEFGNKIRPGQSLIFAHGFALHYQTVPWPKECNWILVAPKGIGRAIRERFLEKSGVPAVLSVENDATGEGWEIAEAIAEGIGSTRVGIYRSTAKEEVEADLFSEQTLLCGGLPRLVAETYDVLVANGIRPEVAYLECVHELAYITNLFQEKGISATLRLASPTARFGGLQRGKELLAAPLRERLEAIFAQIHKGAFVRELRQEADAGYPVTRKAMEELDASSIEVVGTRVRKEMTRGGTK